MAILKKIQSKVERFVDAQRRAREIRTAELQSQTYSLPPFEHQTLLRAVSSLPEVIMNDICMPPYNRDVALWSQHDDVKPLLTIACNLRPRTVVELGTAHGNTIANLCRVCPEAIFYTVNSPAAEQSGKLTTYDLTKDEIGRVYRTYGYADRVRQIYANTLALDLSSVVAPGSVDLAIVDACHDTDYVINDFEKVRRYVRESGVVLLHDTHESMKNHLLGSYVACMKLRKQGYDIRHIPGTWWGIWIGAHSGQSEQ